MNRFFTLKALAYIGTADARAVIREKGLNDPELSVRRTATLILKESE